MCENIERDIAAAVNEQVEEQVAIRELEISKQMAIKANKTAQR